jgi:hypothetical protein
VTSGPVEAECRAPVVNDQCDPVAQVENIEQCIEVLAVFGECVAVGPGVFDLVGVAVADQVRGDEAAEVGDVGQHVAPQIRRGGIAVEEHEGVAVSRIMDRHVAPEDRNPGFHEGSCAHGTGLVASVTIRQSA